MKKLSVVSIVIVAALAISPAVLVGQSTFNWSATDDGLVGSGTLTATPVGGGIWDITGITGTFANSNTTTGDQAFSGTVVGISGYHGQASPPSYSLGTPSYEATVTGYDDLLYLNNTSPASNVNGYAGNGGAQFDSGGLIFNVDAGGPADVYEVEVFQYSTYANGLYIFIANPNNSYSEYESGGGPNPFGSLATNFTVTAVPEGGTSLLYLLLAGAVCFGAAFFSFRNPTHSRA